MILYTKFPSEATQLGFIYTHTHVYNVCIETERERVAKEEK